MDLFFDYSCPYAYLAFTQLERFEKLAARPVQLRPMLLGGVFRARATPQNLFDTLGPAKAKHNGEDMMRWAALFGVPLRMPPEHPRRTVEALRATILTNADRRVVAGFYRAYWVEGRAPSDEATIRDVVAAAGFDADAVMRDLASARVKDALFASTNEAIEKGIFGAPSFVDARGEMYWGQDRMHFAFGLPERSLVPEASSAQERSKERSNMTSHTLELYWDFSSPYAYLACAQAEALAQRTGASLVWRPMLLGGLFKSINQVDVPLLAFSDAKRQYMLQDLVRWSALYGMPFQFPSRFPINTVKALRVWLALPEDRRDAFRDKTFRAMWGEDRDVNDEKVMRELIGEDADAVLARTQDPAIKQALFDATDRAVKAGVFGAPTWVIDGHDLYWGQDRMVLVEHALTK